MIPQQFLRRLAWKWALTCAAIGGASPRKMQLHNDRQTAMEHAMAIRDIIRWCVLANHDSP
jgi:hypothetical protein